MINIVEVNIIRVKIIRVNIIRVTKLLLVLISRLVMVAD